MRLFNRTKTPIVKLNGFLGPPNEVQAVVKLVEGDPELLRLLPSAYLDHVHVYIRERENLLDEAADFACSRVELRFGEKREDAARLLTKMRTPSMAVAGRGPPLPAFVS